VDTGDARAATEDLKLGRSLLKRDRNAEAVVALERARSSLSASADAIGVARCSRLLAAAYSPLGRFDEAIRAAKEAREIFSAASLNVEAALCEAAVANALQWCGRYRESLEAIERARAELRDSSDDLALASVDCVAGRVFIAFDRPEEALLAFDHASGVYKRAADRSGVAECEAGAANALYLMGRHEESVAAAQRAAESYRSIGAVQRAARAELGRGYALSLLGDAADALVAFDAAYDGLSSSENTDVAACLQARGHALFHLGKAREAFNSFRRARRLYSEIGNPVLAAACLGDSATTLVVLERFPEALRAYETAVSELTALERPLHASAYETQLALTLLRLGQIEDALEPAISALATLDAFRYSLSDSSSRFSWLTSRYSYSRALAAALNVALRLPDFRLAAELIETARTQAVPRVSIDIADTALPTPAPRAESHVDKLAQRAIITDPAVPAAFGLVPLSAPRLVSVRSVSRVADALRPLTGDGAAVQAPSPISLEEVTQAVAGPNAVYWGSWIAGDKIYWSLVPTGPNSDKRLSAGAIDFTPTSKAANALAALAAALPSHQIERSEDFRRVVSGPLAMPSMIEAELAFALGDALIPQPLLALLLEAGTDDPLPLVIAPAPELARVPFPLLVIPDPTQGVRTAPRLVERALIRLAPSTGLLASRLSRGVGEVRGPFPLALAVVDPEDTLVHLPALRVKPRRLLTGERRLSLTARGDKATVVGTRSALAEALRRVTANESLFFYAGHAEAGAAGVPAAASLRLAHGDRIYAFDFLGLSHDGLRFPLPSRVFLSACGTSGGESVEWLGLAAASLIAGATQVIATCWPTLDHPATAALEAELVDRLCRGDDAAEAIRDLQLGALNCWRRQCLPDSAVHEECSASAPFIWAPYITIGFGCTHQP
jgi:tetratricopeptide (TPR) repeat protein